MAGVLQGSLHAVLGRRLPAARWPRLRRRVTFVIFPLALLGLSGFLHYDLGRLLPAPPALSVGRTPVSLLTARAVTVEGAKTLPALFEERGFALERVADGRPVPRLFFASLPADLAELDEATLKSVFLRAALPLVLLVNETIMAERRRLLDLYGEALAGRDMSEVDRLWLAQLARRYDAAPDRLGQLLARVDAIPPSLALAQAAAESGWGTSRAALEDRALFGEMTWAAVPAGASYVVRPFADLFHGTRAYALNLNTHRAYAEFRHARAAMRRAGQALDGDALAGTLHAYSERGDAYIAEVRRIMRANALHRFDGANLSGDGEALRLEART